MADVELVFLGGGQFVEEATGLMEDPRCSLLGDGVIGDLKKPCCQAGGADLAGDGFARGGRAVEGGA